ncbi:hypothetical protein QYF36_019340 [Acer negundo]|nr:hypothetical protein QYF36_019340 [Acer negundo]
MIIRNSDGNVLAASSMFFEGTFGVKVAKLMVVLRCLQFDFGGIISEILCLKDKKEVVKIGYIHKGANKVAKGLAENALNAYWMEDHSHCITKEVEADMPH